MSDRDASADEVLERMFELVRPILGKSLGPAYYWEIGIRAYLELTLVIGKYNVAGSLDGEKGFLFGLPVRRSKILPPSFIALCSEETDEAIRWVDLDRIFQKEF